MRTIEIHVPDSFRYEDEEKLVLFVTSVVKAIVENRGEYHIVDTGRECYGLLMAMETEKRATDVSLVISLLHGFEETIIDALLGKIHK